MCDRVLVSIGTRGAAPGFAVVAVRGLAASTDMSRSRPAEILLVTAVVALVGFVASQTLLSQGRRSPSAALSAADSARIAEMYRAQLTGRGAGIQVPEWLAAVQIARLQKAFSRQSTPAIAAATLPASTRSVPGTYLEAMLAEDGHAITRWRSSTEPIRVWVQPNSAERGFSPGLVAPVRRGFLVWNELGLGVQFAMTDDSTQADVHVTWSAVMPRADQIGSTFRVTDQEGWILVAHVVLSSAHDIYMVQNAARHEAGHVLGLGHSPSARDIMAATTEGQQYQLTEADRRTAVLLYQLPAGRVAVR